MSFSPFLPARNAAGLAAALVIALPGILPLGAEWRIAQPGHRFEFPRDHFAHPDFKTEWWYFTGRLTSASGGEHGFQVTFFRQGVSAPDQRMPATSRFVIDHFHFAHAALSDLDQRTFQSAQRVARGAFDEAGNGDPATGTSRIAWIEDWSLDLAAPDRFTLRASLDDGTTLDLELESARRPVANGVDGVSRKSDGDANASHYYSITRMNATGRLVRNGRAVDVVGQAWCDREWGSGQLGRNQAGWDWFSLQLEDHTELMIYQLRHLDGTPDPHSSGTYVDQSGAATHLDSTRFDLIPTAHWTSPDSGARYPVAWRITIPSLGIDLDVEAAIPNQEFTHPPVIYWEGAVDARGSRNGSSPLTGRGFLELTGYAGRVPGLGPD